MPNRNSQGSPKLIYRIDSRPPNEIFEEGFQPWGTNTNFFRHILGYSLGDEIPEDDRSGIISASDSPDSSLRFFGGMMNNPFQNLEYYLYEIRADENVYSAQRTASFYQQRINTGLIDFEEGNLETAIDATDSVLRDFAYQREWFNVGPIPRERVRSAWRVDSVSIDPIHIRHQQDTVYFTPRINEPEILNPNYVDSNTYANDLPYTEGATIATTSRVSIPNELLESDASGGVAASLGFACSFLPDSPRDKRSLNNKRQLFCYYDKQLIHKNLKDIKLKPFILSSSFAQKLYLRTLKTKQLFVLFFENQKNYNLAKLINFNLWEKAPDFIYDAFHRLVWNPKNKEYSYALTPVYVGFQTHYELAYAIGSINDESQKWSLERTIVRDNETLFRIKNKKIKNFSLQREIKTNKLFLRHIDDYDSNFEEVYISISKDTCDTCILLPQESKTKLIDIELSWFYQNQNYVIVPETGWSKAAAIPRNKFFYDLNTYKIVYIDKNGQVFALYNNRGNNEWNWVKWIKSDLQKTTNKNLLWYFQNDKWDAEKGINYRNIRSFNKNDYLRVVITGPKWGGVYTTNYGVDKNSIALFRINKYADI
ncbi:scabin-related ADP-ribosyltransferase [Mycoplasmoides alvi]|uniref:scabin-related ADP-ribosyltransferase n=1 Tax=Mycoplasmoides alvi TaxID=78580 RepID=UPI0006961ED6|nr:hypothetical protein [Mycoplasmoides alvi]